MDCGEAAQIQMRKYGIKPSKIDRILISHLHGDHYYGLMGLLSTMHLFGRTADLHLHGPYGLSEIVTLQLKYSSSTLNFNIHFHEWIPNEVQQIYEDNNITITTIPMDHRIPCMGYLFREKTKLRRINKEMPIAGIPSGYLNLMKQSKNVLDEHGNVRYAWEEFTLPPPPSLSYAFCSDTRYNPQIAHQIQGVDLLYHEATFTEECRDRAEATFHSTAREAALIAKEANVGQLIIGHFSNRYIDLQPVLNEAQSVFENVALALEGLTFTTQYHGTY